MSAPVSCVRSAALGALLLCGVLGTQAAPPLTHGGIVVLGDSLTYGRIYWPGHVIGRRVPHGADWPAVLGRRLPHGLWVVNRGWPGNTAVPSAVHCVPCGPAGVLRFDHDVLGSPGVRVVVLALGTNDLLQGTGASAVAGGLLQMARRAHAAGLRVVMLTIPPLGIPGLEEQRRALDDWIRAQGGAQGAVDAVVDADAVLRDAARPSVLRPSYDSGDGIHPTAAGYAALGGGIAVRAMTG